MMYDYSNRYDNAWGTCFEALDIKHYHQLLWKVSPTEAKPIKWPIPVLNYIHKNHNNP